MARSRWVHILTTVAVLAGTIAWLYPFPQGEAASPLLRLKRITFDPLEPPPDLPEMEGSEAGLYVVQFHGPVQAQWKADVQALGARLYDYLPDFAFLAWIDADIVEQVAQLRAVRWVGPYRPAWRTSPELDGLGGRQILVIQTLPDADHDALLTRLAELEADVLGHHATFVSGYTYAEIDLSHLEELAHWPEVTWISLYHQPEFYNDAARGVMDVQPVWDLGLRGAGQVVAVADTGLDTGDPGTVNADFAGRVDAIIDHSGDWLLDDCTGHGTHVSGSILGNGANSGGQYAGVAPEAHLVMQSLEFSLWGILPIELCLLCLDPNPLCLDTVDIPTLLQEAYNNGARIHSNSWGAAVNGAYDDFAQQVDTFAWQNQDFTIVFAAANSGVDANSDGVVDLDSMGSPGTAKDCITVGASENDKPVPAPNPDSGTYAQFTDEFGNPLFPVDPINSDNMADEYWGMAAFSSRGPCDDGRIKPDVTAPGTWIASVRSAYARYDGWGNPIDANYMYMGGTSMSTPLTSGAAALVRDYYNDVAGLANPSSALIKATLINGAFDMTPGQYGSGQYLEIPVRPNNVEGWGRVDLKYSLVPDAPRQWWFDDHTAGLGTGDQVTYNDGPSTPLNVTDADHPLRVSLIWTDYPGSTGGGAALVNDLDLEVIAPDGTHYYGNGVQWDRVNNVEGVDIDPPDVQLGAYTVIVHAYNVPQSTQPYALVVSGAFGEPASPTATPTETPTETPTATPTETPTATPSPTDTPGPTTTPSPTPSQTSTPTEGPSPTPTEGPTVTPTPSPTPEPEEVYLPIVFKNAAPPWPTPQPTHTPTPTGSPTAASSPTPTSTSTMTPVPPTATPTPSETPVPPTATPTETPAPPTETATATPTPEACGEVIQNGNFEQGQVYWIEQSSGGYDIVRNDWDPPYEGSWVAWFGGYNDADDILTQVIPIPAGAQDTQTITFYLYVETQELFPGPYDFFVLRFLDESGTPLWPDIPIADDTTTMDWTFMQFNQSGFSSVAGQNIQIQFEGTTDSLWYTNFVIDLVSLNIVCGAGASPR